MKAVFIHKSVVALAAVMTMGFLSPAPASADLIVSIQGGLSAAPGTTGNSFEVDVMNNGLAADVIDSFAFEVATTDADITFTGSTYGTTNPYIFAGNSAFGPDINTILVAGQSMDGSDLANTGNGYSLGAGSTIAIGQVFYNVGGGASAGPFTISFLPTTATSFSDITGGTFKIQSLNSGSVTVTLTTVPEPSSLFLMCLALAALAVAARKKELPV